MAGDRGRTDRVRALERCDQMGEIASGLDPQAIVILFGLTVQIALLAGVIHRLGWIGGLLKGHGDRIDNIETRLG